MIAFEKPIFPTLFYVVFHVFLWPMTSPYSSKIPICVFSPVWLKSVPSNFYPPPGHHFPNLHIYRPLICLLSPNLPPRSWTHLGYTLHNLAHRTLSLSWKLHIPPRSPRLPFVVLKSPFFVEFLYQLFYVCDFRGSAGWFASDAACVFHLTPLSDKDTCWLMRARGDLTWRKELIVIAPRIYHYAINYHSCKLVTWHRDRKAIIDDEGLNHIDASYQSFPCYSSTFTCMIDDQDGYDVRSIFF